MLLGVKMACRRTVHFTFATKTAAGGKPMSFDQTIAAGKMGVPTMLRTFP